MKLRGKVLWAKKRLWLKKYISSVSSFTLIFLYASLNYGWTTDVTWTILTMSLLWALNVITALLSMQNQNLFHEINLCSEDEWRSWGLGMTWGGVINNGIKIFGWTIPLTKVYHGIWKKCKNLFLSLPPQNFIQHNIHILKCDGNATVMEIFMKDWKRPELSCCWTLLD